MIILVGYKIVIEWRLIIREMDENDNQNRMRWGTVLITVITIPGGNKNKMERSSNVRKLLGQGQTILHLAEFFHVFVFLQLKHYVSLKLKYEESMRASKNSNISRMFKSKMKRSLQQTVGGK